jgi:hypothetical protein
MSMPQVDGTPASVKAGLQVFTAVAAAGLPGATAASRYAGATTAGAPVAGSFTPGDFVIDQTGALWICTVAGTPGTWASSGSASITTGLDTAKPAASSVSAGDYYFADDTQIFYYSDGAAWQVATDNKEGVEGPQIFEQHREHHREPRHDHDQQQRHHRGYLVLGGAVLAPQEVPGRDQQDRQDRVRDQFAHGRSPSSAASSSAALSTRSSRHGTRGPNTRASRRRIIITRASCHTPPGGAMSTSDAVSREASWLATTADDGLAVLPAPAGPWQVVQAYWPAARTAWKQTAIYVQRAAIYDLRAANQRIRPGYGFKLKLVWPVKASGGNTPLAEGEQQALDNAIELLLERVRGPLGDKSHGGRFLSAGEVPGGREPYVSVSFDDPEDTIPQIGALRATCIYQVDDFEVNF